MELQKINKKLDFLSFQKRIRVTFIMILGRFCKFCWIAPFKILNILFNDNFSFDYF
jgi:hypothetical protein